MESASGRKLFHFPFQPYSIQEKFMNELYFTIESNKLGIFESPTGTGKSLSICCSALQWLKDYNIKLVKDLEEEIAKLKLETSMNLSNDWLQEEYDKIQKNQTLAALHQKLEKLNKLHEKFISMKVKVPKQKCHRKPQELYLHKADKTKQADENDENKESEKENSYITEDVDLIVKENEATVESESDNEEPLHEEDSYIKKIYISSRTHSQLSQFVGEIKRTIFREETRLVTLASRQHYCINPNVSKLKNVNLINERCLDMQNSKSKSTSVGVDGRVLKKTKTKACTACPYYNQTNINILKERLLCDIMDMEELVKCGKEIKACPYYASRAALDDAEVVLVSHAGIVSAGARSGMSLKLKDNILILDEAHGLAAALENAHSAPVSAKYIMAVNTYLKLYIDKYGSRLSSKNLLAVNQLHFIVGKLLNMISKKEVDKKQNDPAIFTLEQFVIKADIDHLNLRKTIEFCRTTRLAPKLHGFSMRYTPQVLEMEMKNAAETKKKSLEAFLQSMSKKNKENELSTQAGQETKPATEIQNGVSPGTGLYAVLDFLQMLCERSECGRVLVQYGEDGQLKYLLLNPTEHFVDVVEQCRSVVVAGGTMEPVSEFIGLLTNGSKDHDHVNIVKCDHVVPPENVVAVCLSKGPTNVNMSFTYEHRMSAELLNEVGRVLRNICNIVPGGVVCFLPSYSYEQTLYEHLKANGHLESINKKKNVFREPKSAAEVDQVLSKYAAAIRSKSGEQNGALMLSVVGGKLSEGLNFSDDLGRCVLVVGMPYPNIKSPELQEKMNYLNKSAPGSGSMYYESLCMKAVNQCIGRAVRHANDYASIILVDERYSRPHTMATLPSFVQKSLIPNCTFGKAMGNIGKFFNKHKTKRTL